MRLYYVRVEFEFPVMAESERDALRSVKDAVQDLYLPEYADVSLAPSFGGKVTRYPDDYDKDSLVYGVDYDLTIEDAIAQEEDRLRAEDFAKKQTALPGMEAGVKKP